MLAEIQQRGLLFHMSAL